MTVLAFLIPGAILGLIAWVVIGFLRVRAAESFTLATATGFYARVLMIIGILMSLTGLGTVFKALFGYLRLAYSYYDNVVYSSPPPSSCLPGCGPTPGYLEQQRGQDLVLGLTLLSIGVLLAIAHFYLTRAVTRMPGGAPTWLTRGTLLALTITTALGAIPSAAIGLYQMLTYFILGPAQSQPWGDSLGAAIAFVPAWLFVMTQLMRSLRRPPVPIDPRD
jgi:hypothetical protein